MRFLYNLIRFFGRVRFNWVEPAGSTRVLKHLFNVNKISHILFLSRSTSIGLRELQLRPMLCFSSNVALLSNPNPNPNPFFAWRRRVFAVTCAVDPNAITPSPTPELEIHPLSRRQNQLLILDPDSQTKPRTNSHGCQETEEDLIKKKVIEEVSLATRRIPRFPGAIDRPDTQRLGPPPDLRRVLSGNDRTLKQALEVRRGVAAETLKFALRAGKLSIRYSDNLVSKLPGFVDRVVIGAAAMKENPELAHLSFNARAKKYIQDSGVVALVK